MIGSGTYLDLIGNTSELDKLAEKLRSTPELAHIAFQSLCRDGNLDAARWVHTTLSIKFDNVLAFKSACLHGHADVAQWLYSIDETIDVYDNGYWFQHACCTGSMNLLRWLADITPNVTREKTVGLWFCYAVKENHIAVMQWLWSTCYDVIDEIWLGTCYNLLEAMPSSDEHIDIMQRISRACPALDRPGKLHDARWSCAEVWL